MTEAMISYFGAKGEVDLVWLVVNGLLATAIFSILLFSHPRGRGEVDAPPWYARLVRFLLASAYGVLALRVWSGWYYTPVEPTHVAVNAVVLWFMWVARGDVSAILEAIRLVRNQTNRHC